MTAKRYRKKPVVVDAIPYDGTNHREISRFTGILCLPTLDKDIGTPITIPTLEGEHIASVGDMIIKGVKGEFYPCKPDIFAETYEPADQNRRSHEMTDAPERIWAFYSNIFGAMWTGVKDEGADEYIRADLAKAQAGALLRQAADAILLGDTVQNLQRRILAIDPDAQAALDRYVQEAVKSDQRVKALVKALELIESLTVHSGGEIHGVTAAHWKTAFLMARDEAEAALAAMRAIGGE